MIWIIGCNGMLGTELCRLLKENKIDFEGTDRSVDITDFSSLEKFAAGKKIDFIVNCAAYTAVDKAESESVLAEKLNVEGPRNIARLAKKIGAKLIHISTDYVFDGTASSPLTEDLPISPIGVYGKTKAGGEKAVQEETSEYYILRTAWLYGWDGKNFVYTMIRAMNTHPAVKVVNDQKGTPTFCGDLAEVILKITKKNIPYGIYHVTDLGEISWWNFAVEIKKQGIEQGLITNPDCAVNPCTTADYPTPAKRPAYSVLSKEKIQSALGTNLPDWKESLRVFMKSSLFNKEMIR
ncbi:MAG: dTDP-4-dehydrorhamnose reductase [Treponema sp.]|nr:dTDP-4-dehydrorhamnose reductase [Treponema sp.]